MSSLMNRTGSRAKRAALAAAIVTAVTGTGCSGNTAPDADGKSTPDEGHGTRAQSGGQLASGALTAFRLIRAPRAQADLARAGATLATILRGKPVTAVEIQVALAAAGVGAEALDVAVEPNGLQFSYRADNDRRLIIDEAVTNNMAAGDIGKSAARSVFASVFRSAVSSGLIAPTGLNLADARSSTIVRGEGMSGQAPVEWISEYIFTVPRMINGIEVFDAGFETFVHRAGQLARIHVFGPSVASTISTTGAEIPDASSYSFNRTVSQADLDSRVVAEYSGSDVRTIGVRYWLPPGIADAVVEPTQMYFVVPTAVIDDHQVKARGFYVAYSLKDVGKAATVWPPAELHPGGDGRK